MQSHELFAIGCELAERVFATLPKSNIVWHPSLSRSEAARELIGREPSGLNSRKRTSWRRRCANEIRRGYVERFLALQETSHE